MLKGLFAAAAISVLGVVSAPMANAALVEFEVQSVEASIVSTQPVNGGGDLVVNAKGAGLVSAVGTQSYTTPGENSITFAAFLWTGVPNSENPTSDTTGDTYSVLARIVLKIGSATHEFIGNGLLKNWKVAGSNGNVSPGDPILEWSPLIGVPNPQFKVTFNSIFAAYDAAEAQNAVFTTVTVGVVPLPAGVLLLGTALLGLFGLSRRRKLATA